MNSSYWASTHREPPEREDMLVDEILKSWVSEDNYPGDYVASDNWPGMAPGTRGILNALSPTYCNWSDLPSINPKPPILWTHGTGDIVVADGSAWDMGTLGKMELIPGWPGQQTCPPQPMVTQIRQVFEGYRQAGGRVRVEMMEGAGHGPHVDSAERWKAIFFDFLASV
jgi:pimeloyl-ACP methyl ester carboxylesterase